MTRPKKFKNWILKSPRFTINEPGVYSFEFVGRWSKRKWADLELEAQEQSDEEHNV